MRTITLAAIAALTLVPVAAVHAQGQPGILRPSAEEEVKVTAVGRVQSEPAANVFTLQVKNLVYRVSYTSGVNRVDVRRGDRVRVTGEIGPEADRILADQVVIVDRGRPSRVSTVVSGSIRSIDREGGLMFVSAAAPDTNLRVVWDEDAEFYRNTTRSGPREFRPGDRVRVIGRRTGNEFRARRVVYGGQPGWVEGGIGEIVSLDARDKEAEVDFDGDIWTVRLANAQIGGRGQRMDIDDLRLGQDVRVYGTARGTKALDATRIEPARSIPTPRPGNDNAGNDNDRRTFDGAVTNVAEGRRTFRIDVRGTSVRFLVDDETGFYRGTTKVGFNQVRDGVRVRVIARREGEDWIASRVTLL